jgi:hypothetical protein
MRLTSVSGNEVGQAVAVLPSARRAMSAARRRPLPRFRRTASQPASEQHDSQEYETGGAAH